MVMTRFHGGSISSATATAVSLLLALFFILDSPATGNPVVDLSSIEEVVNMAGYGEEKLSTVLIDGTILCHPCLHGEKPAARDGPRRSPPHPISGASVGVFCGTSGGRRRRSWARNTTDEYGEFLIDLPSHLHAVPNLDNICSVKVLHLPRDSTCHPSFTGKRKGIKLTAIRDGGVRTYTAHNIHITAKSCRKR